MIVTEEGWIVVSGRMSRARIVLLDVTGPGIVDVRIAAVQACFPFTRCVFPIGHLPRFDVAFAHR